VTDAAAPALPAPAAGSAARSAFAVSIALIAANALGYAFTVFAARALAPAAYGELAALLGVLLVAVVPATGLQTAGALALAGDRPGSTPARLHTAGLLTAGAVAVLAVLAAPLVALLLHLPDPATAFWLAALLVPHTVLGAHLGILQGSGRFARLAAVTAAFTVAKMAGAAAGLIATGTPAGALAGMTVGAVIGAALGWLGCGAPRPAAGSRALVGAGLAAAATLLGFVVLSGLDVILARYWLPAAAAGEYAVGSILTKIVFWLPQGVGVVLLPRLADPADRRRAVPVAIAVVAGLGAVLTIGTAVLGEHALPLIGGAAYGAGIGGTAWAFAVLGTLLAIAQLLLFSGIAAADRLSGPAVWLAVAVEVGVVAALGAGGTISIGAVVTAAAAAAGLLVGVAFLRHARSARR
jgi:O-antigen/teichoic acid export membrane protein